MSLPTIVLADDHRILAEALRSMLTPHFNVVDVVYDGRELVSAAKRLEPDLVVADISMPLLNGIDAVNQLKKQNPKVRVVFLTMHQEPGYASRALEAGASGYVLKHAAAAELVTALEAAMRGETYISPSIAGEVFRARQNPPKDPSDEASRLTPRQREILQLLVEGQSAKQIAAALSISSRTVEYHKYQMMECLHLHTSAELIHFGIRSAEMGL
jgi:DNA-binding NarL/FixJ family response regulator